MSQNGQTHFKNLAANAAIFLKCIWPFWDIMHWRVNGSNGYLKLILLFCIVIKDAANAGVQLKKVFLKISQYSQENTSNGLQHRCFPVNITQFHYLTTSIVAGSYLSSFTPITNIGASADGAEMTTFFAPPVLWALAFSRVVKTPDDSTTISAPASCHLISFGSRIIETWKNVFYHGSTKNLFSKHY